MKTIMNYARAFAILFLLTSCASTQIPRASVELSEIVGEQTLTNKSVHIDGMSLLKIDKQVECRSRRRENDN